LFFAFPDLPAGRYRLEVRAIARHASDLRCGALQNLLLVE
jgi:hypothetical protein